MLDVNRFIHESPDGFPWLLAPLAGVSDAAFRRTAARYGADLAYVEMLSAAALLAGSARTWEMADFDPDLEPILGVQVTGRSAEEVGRAVELLEKRPFATVDINMGCPVRKVVGSGCGSAILKDPERVLRTLRLATSSTAKPVSAKIRIGWDRASINVVEVAQAAAAGGASWVTVHGRTRSDDYGVPVDLLSIARARKAVAVPVFGNGDIFCAEDVAVMREATGVKGIMVSRGALGDPFLFGSRGSGGGRQGPTAEEWCNTVLFHLDAHESLYRGRPGAILTFRKHLVWYLRGWPHVRTVREQATTVATFDEARRIVEAVAASAQGLIRQPLHARGVAALARQGATSHAPSWDPKEQMDRTHDRGVGHLGLEAPGDRALD